MKQLFTFVLLAPLFAGAQCLTFIGADVKTAMPLEKVIEQYTLFDMKVRDSSDVLVRLRDDKGFSTMTVRLDQKKELRGTEVVKLPATVKSIYITGPADRIDKMVKEYFAPLIQPCLPKTSPTWLFWDKYKLVYTTADSNDGIPMKYIEIEQQ
jgi:hypothetical protein